VETVHCQTDTEREGPCLPFLSWFLAFAIQKKFVDCMREEQERRDINALTEAQENGLG